MGIGPSIGPPARLDVQPPGPLVFEEKDGIVAIEAEHFYEVHFNTPGTYGLWARAFSTTSEDNGLQFGINGE